MPTLYLPGIAFMVLVSALVGLAVASFTRHGPRAVLVSTLIATAILEGWAYVDLREFDPVFLLIVMAVALLTALGVNALAASKSRSRPDTP